jgi:hypothetical protein
MITAADTGCRSRDRPTSWRMAQWAPHAKHFSPYERYRFHAIGAALAGITLTSGRRQRPPPTQVQHKWLRRALQPAATAAVVAAPPEPVAAAEQAEEGKQKETATLQRMAAMGFDVARVRQALRADARNHFTTTFRLLSV